MSSKYAFTKSLKEVRFLFCQTSEHSAAVRYVLFCSAGSPIIIVTGIIITTATAAAVARPALAGPAAQQVRGVKTMDFAGSKEDVYGMLEMRARALLRVPIC